MRKSKFKSNLSFSLSHSMEIVNENANLVRLNKQLTTKIISTVNLNTTKIFGNTEFNTQIMLSNSKALSEAADIAKNHNLTIVQYDSCIDQLKKQYKIKGDILIVKTEQKVFQDTTFENIVDIEYYNPDTRERLEKGICTTVKTAIQVPVKLSKTERESYDKLIAQGVDMLNPKDRAFVSKCVTLIDPATDYDTTMSFRINNYLKPRSECILNGCGYKNFTTEGYINCDCTKPPSDNDAKSNYLDIIDSNLLTCTPDITVKIL
jgi:hypothetical protein